MYEEGDIVLCTVTKIVGTTVFVQIEDNGEGSIITSEISSGRIRNLRDYVVPNKKIVCKILRIKDDRIDLSLRRVTAKEREEVLNYYKKEKTAEKIIESVTGKENAEKVLNKIKEVYESVNDFLEDAKEDLKLLGKFFGKEKEKLEKILKERKERKVFVKKIFALKTQDEDGVNNIKSLFKDEEVFYLGGGKYSLVIEAKDFKKANQEAKKILDNIEKKAKKLEVDFEFKEK